MNHSSTMSPKWNRATRIDDRLPIYKARRCKNPPPRRSCDHRRRYRVEWQSFGPLNRETRRTCAHSRLPSNRARFNLQAASAWSPRVHRCAYSGALYTCNVSLFESSYWGGGGGWRGRGGCLVVFTPPLELCLVAVSCKRSVMNREWRVNWYALIGDVSMNNESSRWVNLLMQRWHSANLYWKVVICKRLHRRNVSIWNWWMVVYPRLILPT